MFDYLVELKQGNVSIKANHVCIIAFWASLSGKLSGPINDLALRPNAQSGKFSAHFDKVVGTTLASEAFYELSVPMVSRLDASRRKEAVAVYQPF